MALDTRLPLFAQSPTPTLPSEHQANALTLAGLRTENQLNSQLLQSRDREQTERERELRENAEMNAIVAKHDGDIDRAYPELTRLNAMKAMQARALALDHRTKVAGMATSQLQQEQKRLELASQIARGIGGPDSWARAKSRMTSLGLTDYADQLGEAYDPAVVAQVIDQGDLEQEKSKKEHFWLEQFISGDWSRNAAGLLSTSVDQEEWDAKLQAIEAMGAPRNILRTLPRVYSPETASAMERASMTAAERETVEQRDRAYNLDRLAFGQRERELTSLSDYRNQQLGLQERELDADVGAAAARTALEREKFEQEQEQGAATLAQRGPAERAAVEQTTKLEDWYSGEVEKLNDPLAALDDDARATKQRQLDRQYDRRMWQIENARRKSVGLDPLTSPNDLPRHLRRAPGDIDLPRETTTSGPPDAGSDDAVRARAIDLIESQGYPATERNIERFIANNRDILGR